MLGADGHHEWRAVVQQAFHLLWGQESTATLAHSMGNKGTGGHRVAMVAVTKETSRGGRTSGEGCLGRDTV